MRAEAGSLRSHLLRWLLIPMVALFLLDTLVSLGSANRMAEDAHDKALVEIARELSMGVRRDPSGAVVFDLADVALQIVLEDSEDHVFFEVLGEGGHRIAGSDAISPPPLRARVIGATRVYDAQVNGVGVRAAQFEPVAIPGVRILVAETRNKRERLAREILVSVVVPQVLMIAIAALLIRIAVNRGLAPLEVLQRAVATRSHRDLRPLDEKGVPDELRPIVLSLNALLERLRSVMDLQSRFIADAAHQLKTPVAVLKTNVELLSRDPDGTERRQLLGQINLGIERMSRLVSQLLALARNEPEAARMIDFVQLDLNGLLLDIASEWVPGAIREDIDLGFEGTEQPVWIRGDPGRLREMFDNLIDNAVRYSERGGSVTVRVSAAPHPTVMICDDGPRIPAHEQSRVFERFHRLLGSSEGSGLGLAIAREIADLHSARIQLQEDDIDGLGNMFSVIFTQAREGSLPESLA